MWQNWFGMAIRCWLKYFDGDYVAIVMADLSDMPIDVINMYLIAVNSGYDAVFGSRFIKWWWTHDYPLPKYILNRITNWIIMALFLIKYNDITNACKLYSKQTIAWLQPILSKHFNLTVELPLKTIIRWYKYTYIPNQRYNRKQWISKLKIQEMWSRYFFIIMYCWFENLLSRWDYKKLP